MNRGEVARSGRASPDMETPIASADRGRAAGPAGLGRSGRSATGAQARARPGLPRFLSARCRGAERASGKLGGRRGLRPLLPLPAPEGWPLRLHPARPCRDRRRSLRLPGDRRREPEALDLEGVRVPGDVAPVTRVIRPDLRVRRRVSAHDLEPVSRRRWIDVARCVDRPDPEYVPALVQVLEPPRRAASLVALAIQLAPESRAGVIGDEPELDPVCFEPVRRGLGDRRLGRIAVRLSDRVAGLVRRAGAVRRRIRGAAILRLEGRPLARLGQILSPESERRAQKPITGVFLIAGRWLARMIFRPGKSSGSVIGSRPKRESADLIAT